MGMYIETATESPILSNFAHFGDYLVSGKGGYWKEPWWDESINEPCKITAGIEGGLGYVRVTSGKIIVDGKRINLSGLEFKWAFGGDPLNSFRKHWLLIDMSKGGEFIPDEDLELLSILITAENPNGVPPYDIYQTDNLMTHPEGKKHIAIAQTLKTPTSTINLYYELLLPFDTGWITPYTFATGFASSSFRVRRAGGRIYLEGPITAPSSIPTDTSTLLATLNVGYRPSKNQRVIVYGNYGGFAQVHINTDGTITCFRRSIAGTLTYLDGISFYID